MRIVELIPTLGVGGAERIVSLLAQELVTLGHDVEVVALGEPEDSWIEAELRAAGVPIHHLGKGPGFEARVVLDLARTLRGIEPDVVHTHLHVLKYLLPGSPPYRWRRVVHTLHNLAQNEAVASDRRLQQVAFRTGVVPVAIGDAVADSFAEVYGFDVPWSIPNGIPVRDFQRGEAVRARLRAELGLGDAPTFIVVGRLNEQKNHAMLLRAFADPRLAHARLLVVGDGDLRAGLEAQAAPLGDRVRFLGIRRDVPDLLAASDAFVLSSDWEGNPLVVMEALSAGRAVVSTAVGCVPELVSADTGMLVEAGDEAGLVGALVGLAVDPARTRSLGQAAAAEALARFDASVMARAYVELFERGTPGARGGSHR